MFVKYLNSKPFTGLILRTLWLNPNFISIMVKILQASAKLYKLCE